MSLRRVLKSNGDFSSSDRFSAFLSIGIFKFGRPPRF
jgi:hypothetical protein